MMTILVLNGPNLSLLGVREPAIYGATTLVDVERACSEAGARLGLRVDFRQTNHEGVLIDALHEAQLGFKDGTVAGVVLNAGAYSHTSIALHDAMKGVEVPVIEVHLSNIHAREPFRHHSMLSPAAAGIIVGLGKLGYVLAIEAIAARRA